MALLGTLGVKLTAETAKFERDLKGAGGTLKDFGAAAAKVAATATAAFIGVAGAVASVVKALHAQSNAEIRLAAAAKGSRHAIDPQRIHDLAGAIQDLNGTADEASISTAGFLVGLDLNQKAIERILPGIAAMGTVTGRSADRIARAMGSALQGSVTSLASYGLSLTEAEQKMFKLGDASQRATLIAQVMNRTFGDAAEQMRKTAVGGFGALVGRIGDFQEAVGRIFDSPLGAFFNSLEGSLKTITDNFNALSTEAKKWIFRTTAVTLGLSGLTAAVFAGAAAFAFLAPIIIVTAKIMGVILLAITAITIVVRVSMAAVRAWAQVWHDDVMGIRTVVTTVARAIKTAFAAIKNAVKGAINFILKGFARLLLELSKAALQIPGLTDSMTQSLRKVAFAAKQTLILKDPFGEFFDKSKAAFVRGGKALVKKAKELGIDIGKGLGQEIADTIDAILKKLGIDLDLIMPKEKAKATSGRGGAGAAVAGPQKGLFEVLSEELAKLFEKLGNHIAPGAGETLSKAFTSAFAVALPAIQQGGKNISAVMQGAAEGFKTGGIFGAIIGAVIALFTQTKTFARILRIGNDSLQVVVDLLDKLFKGFGPLVQALTSFGRVLMDLGLSVSGLGTAMHLINGALKGASRIINFVAKAIVDVWNGILERVARVLRNIPKFGKKLAKMVRSAKIKLDKFEEDTSKTDLGGFSSSVSEAADATAKLTESMLNAPAGFKVALRRFQAIDPNMGASPNTAAVKEAEEGKRSGLGTVINNTINITANDSQEVAEKVKQATENESFMNEGSSQSGFNPYATATATPFG